MELQPSIQPRLPQPSATALPWRTWKESPYDTWPYVERRKIPDRRKQATRWWDSLLGRKRRVRGRRKGEITSIYVDVYYNGDLLLVISVFLLNLADATLTLDYMSKGGSEANPFARTLLAGDGLLFVLEKCFLVAACLVALIVHKTFWLARVGVYALLGMYGALTAYHVFLQIQLHVS